MSVVIHHNLVVADIQRNLNRGFPLAVFLNQANMCIVIHYGYCDISVKLQVGTLRKYNSHHSLGSLVILVASHEGK